MAVAAPHRGESAGGGDHGEYRKPLYKRVFGDNPIGYLFAGPYVIFYLALFAYPLGLAVWMAFHDWIFAAPTADVERPFVGFDNFTQALGDADVRRAGLNVLIFLVINVPLTVVVGMVLASALNTALPMRTFFRAAYYVPYVTASVAMIAVWLWLFNSGGLVNQVLGPLAPDPSWLVNSFWAMPIIALFATWKQLGFYVLLYLAAMQNVPGELYEAAKVDGAGVFRRFTSVTVPGVRGTTLLVVVLATIVGANFFTEPYLLTGGGGPNGASVSPVLLMYQEAIQQGNAGYGAAIGVLLAIIVDCDLRLQPVRPRGARLMADTTRDTQPDTQPDTQDDIRVEEEAAPDAAATDEAADEQGREGEEEETSPLRTAGKVGGFVLLALGALVFLFPFWYMVVGSLQTEPNPSVGGAFPDPSNITLANYTDINSRVDLIQTLLNSAIFTGGVIVFTLVLGLLAGYALAVLDFRGRGATFTLVLLSLIVPFQLLMIPLYVLVVRTYGLGDTYLGMIVPFAVNATAVFIFRQFFRSIPQDIFDSARLDGASELQILVRLAIPIARPAILTAIIVTFIGPWNEFLWPFLVTKEQAMQPLAVALANYIDTVAARAANPFGAILAGATVLAIPAVAMFLAFQKYFLQSEIGSAMKG